MTPNLSDAGWGGSASLAADPSTGHLGLSAMFVLFNGTSAHANASIDPFFSAARALAAASKHGDTLAVQEAFTTPVDSFFTWYQEFFPPTSGGSAGTSGALGSWLLPRDVVQRDPEHVAQTLLPLSNLEFV